MKTPPRLSMPAAKRPARQKAGCLLRFCSIFTFSAALPQRLRSRVHSRHRSGSVPDVRGSLFPRRPVSEAGGSKSRVPPIHPKSPRPARRRSHSLVFPPKNAPKCLRSPISQEPLFARAFLIKTCALAPGFHPVARHAALRAARFLPCPAPARISVSQSQVVFLTGGQSQRS